MTPAGHGMTPTVHGIALTGHGRTPIPAEDGRMRASDRDRELATQVLRDACADGRLDLSEFLARTDAACSAKTWGELADLTADLPVDWMYSLRAPGTVYWEPAQARHVPRHPWTPLWWVAVAWLVIAAIAHVAAALPLVLLSLFVLCAAWRNAPAGGLSRRRTGSCGKNRRCRERRVAKCATERLSPGRT